MTLLVNGRVHTPAAPDATAMAFRGGVITWLGGDDVGRSLFPDADVEDLDGGFVTPGFVDSHIHLTATGLTLCGLDLRPARSRAHCLQLIADHAAATPPSTADLDAVLGDRPAYLTRVDVHSALASTGLRRRVAQLPSATGFSPDRPLVGDAHHLVRAAARNLLTAEQLAAAAAGIVAVHECAGPEIGGMDDWLQLRALDHGAEVIGYWGRRRRAGVDRRAVRRRARPHRDLLPGPRRRRGASACLHRGGDHRRVPRHRRRGRRPAAGIASNTSR